MFTFTYKELKLHHEGDVGFDAAIASSHFPIKNWSALYGTDNIYISVQESIKLNNISHEKGQIHSKSARIFLRL